MPGKTKRFLAGALAMGAGLAGVLWIAPQPASGQAKGKAYDLPRLSDGKPDMNGIWNGPAALNADIQAKINGKSVIVEPADDNIHYLPEAAYQQKNNMAASKQMDPMNHCFMPGVPRLMYVPDPFMIVETPGFVAILSQFMH